MADEPPLIAPPLGGPFIMRPAADVSFALLDNRSVVFSEKRQQIYELNRISAFIWCKLVEDANLENIADELNALGLGRDEARHALGQALKQWLGLGFVEIKWKQPFGFTLQTRLAQQAVSIRATSQALIKSLEPLFCEFHPDCDQADITIEIMEVGDEIFFRNRTGGITRCTIKNLAPSIKADLTDRIILQHRPDFALHAASLVCKGDSGLLLCGEPGTGKSTLALSLLSHEYQYCGDDVAIISPSGLAEGLLFAPTIKPGTWDAVSRDYGATSCVTAYDRTDGVRVRYLPVANVHKDRFNVAWIIFLKRIDGKPADMTPIGQIEAMQRVINGSFAASGEMSIAGFAALKKIIGNAGLFELTYAEAADAACKLRSFCLGIS